MDPQAHGPAADQAPNQIDQEAASTLSAQASGATGTQAVAEIKSTLPAEAFDYGADAGAGFEDTNTNDYMVPLVSVLQAQSPEVQMAQVVNAKAGDIFIRALGQIFDGKTGVAWVPCGRLHVFNEWYSRNPVGENGQPIQATGKGFIKQYAEDDPWALGLKQKQQFGRITTKLGQELVETYYGFGLLLSTDGSILRVSVPFESSKINKYRSMMTKARGVMVPIPGGQRVNPPLFAHRYRLKTLLDPKSTAGRAWFNYVDIGFDGDTAADARIDPRGDIYREAKLFHEQIKNKQVQVDAASAGREDDAGGSPSMQRHGGDSGPEGDDSVPF